MQTKLIAGAFAMALAGLEGSDEISRAEEPARPTVVRLSIPLPARVERGHASFSSSAGGREWNVAAMWGGGKAHPHLTLVFASEADE